MTERLTVTVENKAYAGEFSAEKIQVKEFLEGRGVLMTFEEDGAYRLHPIEDVKEITVE
jgi:hypothetical protein